MPVDKEDRRNRLKGHIAPEQYAVVKFLVDTLKDGPRVGREVEDLAIEKGLIEEKTRKGGRLKTASQRYMPLKKVPEDKSKPWGKWWWSLPPDWEERLAALTPDPAMRGKALAVEAAARRGTLGPGSGPFKAMAYNPALSEVICARVAGGELLKDITAEPGFPNITTVYRWMKKNSAFAEAYREARRLSASMLEEDALEMAGELRQQAVPKEQHQAYNIAMQQLRWSAGKRSPQEFGERTNAVAVVPIKIETTLNMDGEGGETVDGSNVYTLEPEPKPGPDPDKDKAPDKT